MLTPFAPAASTPSTSPPFNAIVSPRPLRRHLPALDGIRGIAVIMVMLLHFTTVLELPASSSATLLRSVFQTGWTGVDLFFALSGFLITGLLLDAKGSAGYFRNFYARRMLRIFPLYYLVLALYFFGAGHFGGASHRHPASTQLWYWLFLGNFRWLPWESWTMIGHLWSLGIEEQFYLVWPLLIFFCSRRQALVACVLGAVGALVFRTVELRSGASGWLVYHYTPGRIDGLALGAVVAILIRTTEGFDRVRRASPWAFAFAAGLLAAVVLVGRTRTAADAGMLLMSVGYSAIAMLASSIIAWAVTADPATRLSRFAAARPLRTFGAYSYAIYLFHPILLRIAIKGGAAPSKAALVAHPFVSMLGFVATMMAVSLGVGFVSWHAFEKHFIRLKRHFEYRPTSTIPFGVMPPSLESPTG